MKAGLDVRLARFLEKGGESGPVLGHQNRSTTEIYLHSIPETEREAVVVFGGSHKGKTTQFTHTIFLGLR